jgi:hypothetical protein
MKKALSALGFLILILLSTRCSNDPDETGLGLVSPQDTIKILSSATGATHDTTFIARISGGSTLIGLSDGIESRALLQFFGFNAIPGTAPVDSAVIEIPLNYWFRDSGGTMAFSAYEMLTSWSTTSFTWSASDSTGIHNTTPCASFLKNLQSTDTVLSFRIDSLARSWVQTGTYAPNGIIIMPNTISTNVIAGTRPSAYSDTRPLIKVFYRDTTTADTTITWSSLAAQQAFVADATPVVYPGTIVVQAGVAYRGVIRFDSLSLPPNVSITRATLRLVRDDAHSLLNPQIRDSLLAYLLLKSGPPYDSLALGSLCSPADSSGFHIYTADVRTIVQQWIIRKPNFGIVLRPYGEPTTFDRFSIYGSSAIAGLRPRLTITYTVLP